MSRISDYVGKQIRMYRKTKNLTLEQFSALLHKSKSTISKYENGEISIDIETLYDIANSLKIDIRQLLAGIERYTDEPVINRSGFFSRQSRYYVYYFLNRTSTKVTKSLLEIYDGSGGPSSVMFVDVSDFASPNRCRHLYYGDIHFSDSFINLIMQNQDNSSERIFFNIINTFGQETVTTGILSGTSSKYMTPISLKTLISKTPLTDHDQLIDELRLSKQDISAMRKTCCFSIDRTFPGA